MRFVAYMLGTVGAGNVATHWNAPAALQHFNVQTREQNIKALLNGHTHKQSNDDFLVRERI